MDDLISRQAAIRWVKTECNPYGKPTLEFESGKKVIEHLKQMPSAQQWIPCSEVTGEGYPKEDGSYYVTERNYGFYLDADSKQNVAHISHFFNGDFTDRFYDENHSNIVAWMPMPKPYKMDDVIE